MRTAAAPEDLLATDVLAVSGMEELREALDSLVAEPRPVLLEALFCRQGCLGGPLIPGDEPLFTRRLRLVEFARTELGSATPVEADPALLAAEHAPGSPTRCVVAEVDIERVLAETGKANPEDRLDCGACGYVSCRDKAWAVLAGLAEKEMCLPLMRRLAERRTDRIMETSPNGIVILDEELAILHMNPAFREMFLCSDAHVGQPIARVMDPGPFERLAAGARERIEETARHPRYSLVCHQILYRLPEERQYVGIFLNVTQRHASREELTRLRQETLARAQELLEHQVEMAEKMAGFLGESSARGEELLERLVDLAQSEPRARSEKTPWAPSTSTSRPR